MSAEVGKSSRSVVLLPVGSLEQHGTEAPLGCDGIIAEALCRMAGEKTGCAVLPGLFYGNSLCHTGFPGTFSLSEATYTALLGEIIAEAARNGFRNILIISGHGGNRPSAIRAVRRAPGDINASYRGFWELPGVSGKEEELFGKTGFHITTSEVSMVWHILSRPVPGDFRGRYPEQAKDMSALTPEQWIEMYPDGGVGGDMSRVSVDRGKTLLEFAADSLAGVVRSIR